MVTMPVAPAKMAMTRMAPEVLVEAVQMAASILEATLAVPMAATVQKAMQWVQWVRTGKKGVEMTVTAKRATEEVVVKVAGLPVGVQEAKAQTVQETQAVLAIMVPASRVELVVSMAAVRAAVEAAVALLMGADEATGMVMVMEVTAVTVVRVAVALVTATPGDRAASSPPSTPRTSGFGPSCSSGRWTCAPLGMAGPQPPP